MDCDMISVVCGVEAECVGHCYRCGAFQRAWVWHYRPDRWPNVVGIRVLSPVRRQGVRLCRHFARSPSVATQMHLSSPGSRSSTLCFDLADFDSESSPAALSSSGIPGIPVSPVSSVPMDLLVDTSWFMPLSPQFSLMSA